MKIDKFEMKTNGIKMSDGLIKRLNDIRTKSYTPEEKQRLNDVLQGIGQNPEEYAKANAVIDAQNVYEIDADGHPCIRRQYAMKDKMRIYQYKR